MPRSDFSMGRGSALFTLEDGTRIEFPLMSLTIELSEDVEEVRSQFSGQPHLIDRGTYYNFSGCGIPNDDGITFWIHAPATSAPSAEELQEMGATPIRELDDLVRVIRFRQKP